MDKKTTAVVLAAGQGTRMKSSLPKVLHGVLGRTMVERVVASAEHVVHAQPIVVVGYGADQIRASIDNVVFVTQEEQLGTGHAVLVTAPHLDKDTEEVVVVYGDTPLLEGQDLQALVEEHRRKGAGASFLTAVVEDPTGYGRVIRDEGDLVVDIVEHKDAGEAQLAVREVLGGAFCFNAKALFSTLRCLDRDNVQREYQLPKVIPLMIKEGYPVVALRCPEPERILGVNSKKDLSRAEMTARERVTNRWMEEGITIVDPLSVYIWESVHIGQDTVIEPFTILEGNTRIGACCHLGPGAHLRSVIAGNKVKVMHSVIEESHLEDDVQVGPFSHIRPGCVIRAGARIGNFAEIKNSEIGRGVKVNHHSYIGDASLGANVNIGAGVITVNYDGVHKHRTMVEEGAFIGCNTNLIAPVTIGKEAYIAAGSSISRDVQPGALGISRSAQENVQGWVERKRAKGT